MSFYNKFIELKQKDRSLNPALEPLMIAIALYEQEHSVGIRCTDLIMMKELGSPATIHKNYQSLLKRGFLELAGHITDKRIKYIRISDLGHRYFRRMEDLIFVAIGLDQSNRNLMKSRLERAMKSLSMRCKPLKPPKVATLGRTPLVFKASKDKVSSGA